MLREPTALEELKGILGEFLRQKRHEVTVTTKFGIQPPSGLAGNIRVINAFKKFLRPFPGLLRQARNRGAAMVKARPFHSRGGYREFGDQLARTGNRRKQGY